MLSFSGLLLGLGLSSPWWSTAFAAPVDGSHDLDETLTVSSIGLVKRQPAPGTPFDIKGWEGISEENSYAMLCRMNGRTQFTRVDTPNARGANQRASGASLRPFQDDQLATRHTEQIGHDTVSAEEFPWESLKEGGANAFVFPATLAEQQAQSGAITKGYSDGNIDYGDAVQLRYINTAGPLGPYCTALFSNPPDHSVCNQHPTQTLFGVTAVDIAEFVFQVVKAATPYTFVHMDGSRKGTKRSEDLVRTGPDAVHDAHLAAW